MARRVDDRPGVRLEGLDEHAPRRVAAAAPGQLREQLEGPLLGAEVRHAEARVGVDDRGERDAARSDGPSRPSASRRARPGRPRRSGAAPPRAHPDAATESASSRIRSSSGTFSASSRSSCCVPAPSRASSAEPHSGQRRAPRSVATQWWQCSSAVGVQDERDVAVRAAARRARTTRQWIAGATPRRFRSRIALPPPLGDRAELGEQRRRERIAGLAAEVDDLAPAAAARRGARRARAARAAPSSPAAASPMPKTGDRALERGPLRGDGPRVVARIRLLLVGRRRAPRRRRSRRPGRAARRRPSGRRRRSRASPRAIRSRSSRRSASVSAEWRTATRSPKRARRRPTVCGASAISGHEHDRAAPALERRGARLEVDLGLAAARRAVEEEAAAAARRAPDDPRRARACCVAESAAGSASPPSASPLRRRARSPARLPLQRRDQLQRPAPASSRSSPRARARGRRAARGSAPTTSSTGDRLDPVGRPVLEPDDDAAPPRAAEPHGDDGALADVVRRPRR